MTFFDGRAHARDAAARLHGMLREVRGAPKDARDFLVFDKRDDWRDLGVGDDHIAGVDLTDDGLLDKHIAECVACLRALGHREEDAGDDVAVTGRVASTRRPASYPDSPYGPNYLMVTPKIWNPYWAYGGDIVLSPEDLAAVERDRRKFRVPT